MFITLLIVTVSLTIISCNPTPKDTVKEQLTFQQENERVRENVLKAFERLDSSKVSGSDFPSFYEYFPDADPSAIWQDRELNYEYSEMTRNYLMRIFAEEELIKCPDARYKNFYDAVKDMAPHLTNEQLGRAVRDFLKE